MFRHFMLSVLFSYPEYEGEECLVRWMVLRIHSTPGTIPLHQWFHLVYFSGLWKDALGTGREEILPCFHHTTCNGFRPTV